MLELFSQGYSLFLTGKGGCGKSFVLKGIIESVIKNFGPNSIAVTAPTGKAALNIGGQTIHAWAGVGLGHESRYKLCDKVLGNLECLAGWNKCRFLLIDEVSQLGLNLFEKLEFIARQVKNTDAPFGGLQLIFSGDFYQLPPVSEEGEKFEYCFRSVMWSKCIDFSISLTRVIRQSESEFLALLDEVRQGGCLSPNAIDMLNSLTRPIEWMEEETVLKLFPHQEKVQEENSKLLNNLPSETHTFIAIDGGRKSLIDKNCPAQKTLLLKVGAPVMLIKNYPSMGLVNGSIGTVSGFVQNFPQVRFENGQSVIVREYTWSLKNGCYSSTRRQLPLVLSWGMTIHKCQGQTLSKAEVSLSNLFVPGRAYVALSRVKKLEGLRVLPGFDTNIPTVSKYVQQFYQEKVSPAKDVNCEDVIPVRMAVSNAHDTQILIDNEEPMSNNWKHTLPLPATVNLKKILEDMLNDEMNSPKTKQLMTDIGFDKKTVPSMLYKFICHSWMELEKLATRPQINQVVVVSRKNWVGYAGGIHKLKISTDLSNRWIEVLNDCEVLVGHGRILNHVQRSVMAQIIDKLHDALTGM